MSVSSCNYQHIINVCAHMSVCLQACVAPHVHTHSCTSVHLGVGDFILLVCPCVWWLQICFPPAHHGGEQRGRATANVDGQPVHVSETIWHWQAGPTWTDLAFRFSRTPLKYCPEHEQARRENTEELIRHEWILLNLCYFNWSRLMLYFISWTLC